MLFPRVFTSALTARKRGEPFILLVPPRGSVAAGTILDENWQPPETQTGTSEVPVVMLHGTIANGGCWEQLAERLMAEGRQVAVPTFGARGTSGISQSYGEVTDVVHEVLRKTGAKQVDLVGHSQGGMLIGWIVAAMYGNGPDSIVEALPRGSIRTAIAISGTHRGVPRPRKALRGFFSQAIIGESLGEIMLMGDNTMWDSPETWQYAIDVDADSSFPHWYDIVSYEDGIVPATSALRAHSPIEMPGATTLVLEKELGHGVRHPLQPSHPEIIDLVARILHSNY